jgi:GAF domain-containing protein
MAMSSTTRAWIVVAILLACLLGGAAALYFWHNRPLPPIVSTVPGAPAAVPPSDILSELPSDAPVVAYIDAASLRSLQNSPLAAALGLASPGPQADRDYANFVRDAGFDYTRDLDHAAIAFWPASLGTPANVLGEDRVVAIADGRFDQQKIKSYALRTGKEISRGSQSVCEVPGNPPVSLEFLAPTRIALAGGRNATELLARVSLSASSPRDPSMQSRIDRVAGAPVFAVARTEHLPPSFYDNFHNAPQLEQLARSVQAITLAGQPDGNNLRITLDAESDSVKNALAISILLEGGRMAGSMALSDPNTRRQMTKEQITFLEALVNQAKITHQNKLVRLVLDITPAMLSAAPSRAALPRSPAVHPVAH